MTQHRLYVDSNVRASFMIYYKRFFNRKISLHFSNNKDIIHIGKRERRKRQTCNAIQLTAVNFDELIFFQVRAV